LPCVQVMHVNMVAPQAFEAVMALLNDVEARQPALVRTLAHWEADLGRDQKLRGLALDRLTYDLFRTSSRIDIRGVNEIDAVIDAEIDHAARFGDAPAARLGEEADAAEGHRAQAMQRNAQARATQLPILHATLPMFVFGGPRSHRLRAGAKAIRPASPCITGRFRPHYGRGARRASPDANGGAARPRQCADHLRIDVRP
jgi:hypothetical protein